MSTLKLISLSLLAACALAACTAPSEQAPTLTQFETLDRSSAQAVYATLAPLDQAALWQDKLARELRRSRSPEATALIREIREHVVEILTDPAVSARYQTRATEVLGEGEVDAVFGSFDNVIALDDEIISEDGGGATCNDRWNCGTGCSCGVMPNQSWACRRTYCDTTCTATSSGCGWFWSQSCTGILSSTLVPSC